MTQLAILGGGNIGQAIARGLVAHGSRAASDITITRRHTDALADLEQEGFVTHGDNTQAVADASFILVCVQPQQARSLLEEIRPAIDGARQQLVSIVTGVHTDEIRKVLGSEVPITRAMPNTAVALGESMTCVAGDGAAREHLEETARLFDAVGHTMIIDESQMTQATALCACGVAFFLRAIRAASQGGIEIGFHAEEALAMAAQTARGAATLLRADGAHPEPEIDRVTTPKGCTIAGLNQMEHDGFSSALIRGIVTSARIASTLGNEE